MIFNTLEFVIFLSLFLFFWQWLRKTKYNYIGLSICSLLFYFYHSKLLTACLFLTVMVDYLLTSSKKVSSFIAITLSTVVNIGMLVYFKYFSASLHPAGLSFFVFQSLSHVYDKSKGIAPRPNSFWSYLTYISMFPQLIAGPICRSRNVLTQIQSRREVSFPALGMRLMVLGYFKKVVVADHIALVIDPYFNNSFMHLDSAQLWILLFTYSFQIYFDFSGYTDIARGIGYLIGFKLPLNFKFPYHSLSLTEFWKSWHITLSTWFKNYVYLPLGGSKTNISYVIVLVVFILSGLWHGNTLNFFFWGLYHGLFLIVERLTGLTNPRSGSVIVNAINWLKTFMIVSVGWLFFRVCDLDQIFVGLERLFIISDFNLGIKDFYKIGILLFVSVTVYLLTRFLSSIKHSSVSLGIYCLMVLAIVFFRASSSSFIYYRF